LQVRNNQNRSEKCQKFEQIQVRSTGIHRNFFREGKLDILLILSILLTMQCKCTFTKRFALSIPKQKFPQLRRGVTKGGTIPRAPNHCGEQHNIPTMSQILSSTQYICFGNVSGSNMGAPNLLLAPGAI